MDDDRYAETFGCERCWPPVAKAAWQARGLLTTSAELIDESHFHVTIRVCPECGQRFVSVFTETIDWSEGDDPQYWTLLPVTEAEAVALVQQGDSLTETKLDEVGVGRRCLMRNRPKGEEEQVFWGTGMRIGPHD